MGKIILRNAVKRKKGFLYYIDGKGNLCSAKMARKVKKKLMVEDSEDDVE